MAFTHLPGALLPLCLTLILAACAGQSAAPDSMRSVSDPRYSQARLLDGSIAGLAPEERLEPVDILAVNDDMHTFLDAHVPADLGSRRKVELILAAILDDGLRLDYNLFETHTAEEAFYSREGNCMSFTNLFVALARASGVSARFQEIEVPPTWEAQGDMWLFNKHVNAVVDLPGGRISVDFALDAYDADYRRRMLEDDEVQARYHNNMGVHLMSQRDFRGSFLHFRRALEIDPDTAYFWTNLGTLYRRLGETEAAEATFLTAIEVAPEPAAYSNLARLYRDQGVTDMADYYGSKVQLFRRKNPFNLYHLAEQAYDRGDFSTAVKEARAAIRLHQGEHTFHRLLGLAYIQLNEIDKAQKQFGLAAELAADAGQREHYNRKLELLAKH
jgi:Flp pilus assembly protein TadD